MRSDIEIAQSTPLQPIARVAEKLGLGEESLEPYGRYMAKLRLPPEKPGQKRGKLILVTAINPTKAGEGKTTTSIGLADALNRLGKKGGAVPAGAVPGACVRHEGRRHRRRLCPGRSHGGHQSPFHRGFSCHRHSQ